MSIRIANTAPRDDRSDPGPHRERQRVLGPVPVDRKRQQQDEAEQRDPDQRSVAAAQPTRQQRAQRGAEHARDAEVVVVGRRLGAPRAERDREPDHRVGDEGRPTWPASAAPHQTSGPSSWTTAPTAKAVSAICGAASPSTTRPLVSSRQTWPRATSSALASSADSETTSTLLEEREDDDGGEVPRRQRRERGRPSRRRP